MLIQESNLIPDWLKVSLEPNCPYCKSPYHVGHSPNGMRVTKHYCPNRECPGTVTMKMVFVWTILKVDGIKEGRSMELVKRYNITRHMDAIPYVLKEKPKVDLATFMRLNCIQGIDSSWENICQNKNSVEEVIQSTDAQRILSPEDIKDILDSQQYVDIIYPEKQEYECVLRLTVMMTGDIMGLPNREYLIAALNKKYKGLLDLRYSKSIRRTGIYALIKESTSTITGKVNTAVECGIPILTPQEFILRVDNLIREKVGDKYDI